MRGEQSRVKLGGEFESKRLDRFYGVRERGRGRRSDRATVLEYRTNKRDI